MNKSILRDLIIIFIFTIAFIVIYFIYFIHRSNTQISEFDRIYENNKYVYEWKDNQSQRIIKNILEKGMANK